MILTKYYYPSGTKKERSFWSDDGLSRSDGPALIKYNEEGRICHTEYWVAGVRHRTGNLPAVFISYEDDEHSEYWEFGQLHRHHGPAIHIVRGGEVITKKWWIRGKLHGRPAISHYKEGLPRKISNYENGKPCELWQIRWECNSVHFHYRITGKEYDSKRVGYWVDGGLIYVEYRKDGLFHKTDGPAEIAYPSFEEPTYLCYYTNGERRQCGPYMIKQHSNGDREESCLVNLGPDHHDEYVARYDGNGKVVWTKYYRRGRLHRLDGPAVISEKDVEYYVDGVKIDAPPR